MRAAAAAIGSSTLGPDVRGTIRHTLGLASALRWACCGRLVRPPSAYGARGSWRRLSWSLKRLLLNLMPYQSRLNGPPSCSCLNASLTAVAISIQLEAACMCHSCSRSLDCLVSI